MNIAVLSLARDRLDYTKHCFQTLIKNAGCEFDWWITDNGSEDNTVEWLLENLDATVIVCDKNAGICPALNFMLDDVLQAADYDVIVKVDNDCELLTPNTLRDVCERAYRDNLILSPHIHGLRQPPQAVSNADGVTFTNTVGGIFMATPAWMFKQNYRHPETTPLRDGDDFHLCRAFQMVGGRVGYLDGYHANHYETTDGQWARYPEYFARRDRERVEAGLQPA